MVVSPNKEHGEFRLNETIRRFLLSLPFWIAAGVCTIIEATLLDKIIFYLGIIPTLTLILMPFLIVISIAFAYGFMKGFD